MRTFPASLAGALTIACFAAGCSTATSPAPANGSSLPFLHVVHPTIGTPYLADPEGRRVILRGVAASGFEDQDYSGAAGTTPHYPIDPSAYAGRCPANDQRAPDPPLCEVEASRPPSSQSAAPGSEDDFAQIHRFGFNLVRLTLNWSELEPYPGSYSTIYLNRIAQVVHWAAQQGIYVILDMHEDQYSRFLATASASAPDPTGCSPSNGQDGAPLWAVVTDGQPSCALFGQNELNPAMAAAFQNFWDNSTTGADGKPIPQGAAPGPGLEDHYIGALARLARRFGNDPAVLGYEVINEPLPGAAPGTPLPLSNLYAFSDHDLFPFYRRVVEALTGVRDGMPTCSANNPSGQVPPNAPAAPPTGAGSGVRSALWFGRCAYPSLSHLNRQEILVEPTGYTNLVDFAPQVSVPFTSYPNLVYSPHVYTHVFTVDRFLGGGRAVASSYPPSYQFGYATAIADAQSMHAALLVTEFGDSPAEDSTILAGMTAAQERSKSGSVFWTWKENCGNGPRSGCVNGWGVYQPPPTGAQNGPLAPSRIEYLQRAWPVETAGTLVGYLYDPVSHSFAMKALASGTVAPGDRGAETVISLPPACKGAVIVTGAARLDRLVGAPGGGRIAYVATTTHGAYRVEVSGESGGATSVVWNREAGRFLSEPPLQPIGEVQARSALEAWAGDAGSPIVSLVKSLILGPPGQDPNR